MVLVSPHVAMKCVVFHFATKYGQYLVTAKKPTFYWQRPACRRSVLIWGWSLLHSYPVAVCCVQETSPIQGGLYIVNLFSYHSWVRLVQIMLLLHHCQAAQPHPPSWLGFQLAFFMEDLPAEGVNNVCYLKNESEMYAINEDYLH